MSKYATLPEFLEQAALMMTDDNDSDDAAQNNCIRIMTIHAAKGLEFDTVFLPAWEEGVFPNEKSINEGAIEEERRLAYVAITRARRRCVISNAMSRMVFGSRQYNSPSRFITEMDSCYLDFQGGTPRSYHVSMTPSYAPRPVPRPRVNVSLVGKLVSHPEMGAGVVIEDSGDILTIAFKTRGIKKVARNFIKIDA
jgi:DNA helicase-2/ATP-dependent DNA helicase PcrA